MRELALRLERRVRHLAEEIGPRHYRRAGSLSAARDFIESELRGAGIDAVALPFSVSDWTFHNVEVVLKGARPDAAALVVGAHYDTVPTTPGADDNASAVAALLEMAEQLHGRPFERSVHLVWFPNEEPPFYPNAGMGSAAYASRLREQGTRVEVMISLEMLGYYSDQPGSQKYPPGLSLFYPDRGHFIGFVGNRKSRHQIEKVKQAFRSVCDFPCESLAAPEWTVVVGLSDHRSFWSEGFPGLMVTDTAFMRNPHYHGPTDTPETLDYPRFAQVTQGMVDAVALLAQG